MVTLAEIEARAMNLTLAERVTLASRLLESISNESHDDDEGMAEALQREAEMDADPSMCVTLEELKLSVGR